jgi:hypothetical protein
MEISNLKRRLPYCAVSDVDQPATFSLHASRGSYKQHVLELGREHNECTLENDQPMLRMTSEVMRVGIVLCMFPGAQCCVRTGL